MPESFSQNEWTAIAEYVADELQRRQSNPYRLQLERNWAEVDRQIAMKPKTREVQSGQAVDWMPNTELSLQFNALEVIMADARRMKFPRGREWFTVRSELSEEYIERFEKRRLEYPLIDGVDAPVKLDQETADTLVKAAFDHYHWMYDFRSMSDLLDAEAIKYGTFCARIREVTYAKFTTDERGVYSKGTRGPAVIPCSIKNTYLDDVPAAVMHEGYGTTSATIRTAWKNVDDLKRAAKSGADKGWRAGVVSRIELKGKESEHRGQVLTYEYEGDLYVPGSKTSRYLPNVRVMVAVGIDGGPKVIRFEADVNAEVVIGTYIRENMASPYGLSPLMKGAPIQEAASEALNRLMAAAALNAEPHIIYDKNDQGLIGGVRVSPGGMTGVDDVETSVKDLQIGDPAALLQVYIALIKQYEDVTGVNDPRKGAQTKSHTTAMAADIEQARGQQRTEDYVVAVQQGPLTQILYKEYEIIKRVMSSPQRVAVNAGGIEGWVKIAAKDLPDRVYLEVHGALGPFDEREKSQMFMATTTQAMQLIGMAKQLGLPAPELNLEEAIRTLYQNAGTNDSQRYISIPEPPALPAPRAPAGSGAIGPAQGIPPDPAAQVLA